MAKQARTAKQGGTGASTGSGFGGPCDFDLDLDLTRNAVVPDVRRLWKKHCRLPLDPQAEKYFCTVIRKTLGRGVGRGRIRAWGQAQKTYCYPHISGIAAKVEAEARRKGESTVSRKRLRGIAHPWILDAKRTANDALSRLRRRKAFKGVDPESLRDLTTVYCEDYN